MNISTQSPRGVYYRLEDSTFHSEFQNARFTFSSQFNLDRFNTQLKQYLMTEVPKMAYTLGLSLTEESELIAAIKLYQRIEKRGFLIAIDKNGYERIEFKCPDDMSLNVEVKPTQN